MPEALRAKAGELVAALGLVVVAFLAAGRSVPGETAITLQLGPNDHHYLTGFAPHYEVETDAQHGGASVAARWTTYDARIELPLRLAGGPIEIAYRFSRVFGETAEVEVLLDGVTVDRFSRRGGEIVTRSAVLAAVSDSPLVLDFKVDSHERQNLGLRMDWVRVRVGERGRVWLSPRARWLPALFAGFLFALLTWSGLGRLAAVGMSLGWIAALSWSLSLEILSTAHIGARILPMGAVLALAAAAVLRRFPGGRWAVAIFIAGYLIKGFWLFHPASFYPDVANARDYVEAFRDTTGTLAERGVATQERTNVGYPRTVGGKDYAFPYSPLYFAPLGLFEKPGAVEDAVRLFGLASGSLALIPVFWLAFTVFGAEAAVLASWLWIFMPAIFSRLVLALHATVVGNFLDLLVIVSVLLLALEPERKRRLSGVVGATLLSLLVYTSSLFSVSALFLFAAGLLRRIAVKLVATLAVAGTLTVTWLYWPFLIALFSEILPAMLAGGGGGGAASEGSPVAGALSRVPLFYGFVYPVLAAAGLVLARRRASPEAYRILLAWTLGFVLMLSLRAFGAGVFKDLKEITFVAPLVAILSGGALAAAARRGVVGRVAALALAAWLAWFGFWKYQSYLVTYTSPVTTHDLEVP